MRIMLLEPDAKHAEALSEMLREQNMQVTVASTSEEAFNLVENSKFTAVVLEDQLPDTTSANWILQFRENNHGTPVIVLTDNADPDVKISLLDQGADEVVVHPVTPNLLPAQIRALARRCEATEGAVLKFDDLSLDLRSLQVMRQDQPIPCTSREIAVLEYLLRNNQRVVSRTELAESVWDGDAQPDSNVIEVFIARLRRKIDRPFAVPLIHTIVGRGYMLSETKPGMRTAQPAQS